MVKPDGISRGLLPEILRRIKNSGLEIIKRKTLRATEKQCHRHYDIKIDTKIRNYGSTKKQITDYLKKSYLHNKNICAIVVAGDNAIMRAYRLKIKIRKTFGIDTIRKCRNEKRALYNVMHSSDSVEDSRKEIRAWLN